MGLFSSKKFLIPFGLTTGLIVAGAATVTGITLTSESYKLNQAANRLNVSNIKLNEFGNVSKTLDIANTYAFNVKKSQISFLDRENNLEGYRVEYELDLRANPIAKLNDGILTVIAKVTNKNTNNSTYREIEVSGFKVATNNSLATGVLKENGTVLDLTTHQTSSMKYLTIEQINEQLLNPDLKGNKECSLDKLISTNSGGSNGMNCTIRGQVRLDRMVVENDKTTFYLASEDISNPLRLLKPNGSSLEEVAITHIKVNNLLATSITAVPTGLNPQETQGFFSLLIKTDNQVAYRHKDGTVRLYLEIDPKGGKTESFPWPVAKGFLDPYVAERNNNQNKTIDVNLIVSFGIGRKGRHYSTLSVGDLKLLNDAGFSFGIFTKKLTKDNTSVTGTEIRNETNEVAELFKTASLDKPYTRPSTDSSNLSGKKLGFTEVKSNQLTPQISLNKSNDDQNNNNLPQNWLVGIDYSYKGVEMNKVLLAASITLIHLK